MTKMRERWQNTYYGWVCLYITVLVTLIFAFQMYRYFVSAPSDKIRNDASPCSSSAQPNPKTLVPLIGVFFDDR